jgi:hypothetical protein
MLLSLKLTRMGSCRIRLRSLTFVDVRWRSLAFVDVRWRSLALADVDPQWSQNLRKQRLERGFSSYRNCL